VSEALDGLRLAERVLSAWFYDQRFKAAWKPEPDLFLLPAHRAMAELMAARGPALTDTGLTLEMRRMGQLELFPGLGAGSVQQGANAIADIVHGCPVVLDPWEALAELRADVAYGRLHGGVSNALRMTAEARSLPDLKAGIAAALGAADGLGAVTAELSTDGADAELARVFGEPRVFGCPTGSASLDRTTGGLRPLDVWAIGAPTNWGKSSYLCALYRRAIGTDRRVLIVSGEDPFALYMQRILGGLAGVNAWRMREARLLPFERERVRAARAQIPTHPLFVNGIGRAVESLAADIRSVLTASEVPPDRWIVMVDYLQAFRSAHKHQDRRAEIIHCSRLFTDAIKTAGAAGILTSQVTRGADGKLKMREADDIIHAAEVGLYGEMEDRVELDFDGRKQVDERARSFFVAKIKNGPSGFTAPLTWDANAATFGDNSDELEAA